MTRALRPAAAALALAVIAIGWTVHELTGELGTATPPFVAGWLPRIDAAGALAAAVTLAAAVAIAPRLLDRRLAPAAFSAAAYGLALAVGLAANLARYGTAGWWQMFALSGYEGPNEYLPGLPALSYGVRFYLDRFAELVPSQSVNVAGHPPGPPLAHRLAWTLHGEATGRIAALLCALSPALVLFGVSSYDVVFAAIGALAACGLVSRSPWWRAAGVVVFALGTLMSWALLGVGAWAAVLAWRRQGLRAALALAAACAVTTFALDGALALATGYDPIGALRATEQVYRNSLASRRPYAFWVLGSPVAWAVMLGPPIATAALAGLAARRPEAIALAVVVAVAALGGFTKAETE